MVDALPGGPVEELLDQAGLADAGLSCHQHKSRLSGRGGPPVTCQLCPLLMPAHQGRGGRQCCWKGLGRGRRWLCLQHPLIRPARGRAGIHAQFALQNGGAGVVGAQRRGAVAGQGVQAHQPPVGRLVERVVPQHALGVIDRPEVVALLLQQAGQPFQRSDERLLQSLPFRTDPVGVAARQQVPLVDGHGLLERLL